MRSNSAADEHSIESAATTKGDLTAYLEAGGALEHARMMAAQESPRTTKLYDRTADEVTLDEIERITTR